MKAVSPDQMPARPHPNANEAQIGGRNPSTAAASVDVRRNAASPAPSSTPSRANTTPATGCIAAKNHQAEVEARIRQLQAVLARAQIIDASSTPKTGRIALGAKVVLHDVEHDEDLEYTLVSPNEANPRAGRISVASPVGRALLDRGQGDEVEVEAPGGTIKYRVSKVER